MTNNSQTDFDHVLEINNQLLKSEYELAGPSIELAELDAGAIGFTMFDSPSSKDNLVPVLLPRDRLNSLPSQSIVRIRSRSDEKGGDGRQYLAAVVEGPFAEPDGLRADSHLVVTTTIQGAIFMPQFHGRVLVKILGEESDGDRSPLIPPRFRPLPNSPVFALTTGETREFLGLEGDLLLGHAIGMDELEVRWPSEKKSLLPRHVGILGTTGGGKSTTVAKQLYEYSKAGIATVVIDTEGEYTHVDQPTSDATMLKALHRLGQEPAGLANVHIYHVLGRETTASKNSTKQAFTLNYWTLSPYVAVDILDLTPAQQDRYFLAYEATKAALRKLNITPKDESEKKHLLMLDEFQTGYPRITLSRLIDMCNLFLENLTNSDEFEPFNYDFKNAKADIMAIIKQRETSHPQSWRALLSKLWRIHRLGIFDNPKAKALPIEHMLTSGRTSIIDLSDTDAPMIRNLVIAQLLTSLQRAQAKSVANTIRAGQKPTPLVLVIEEAHEFLSRSRADKMRNLFEQVSRIAKRGRKRWFGLIFVTQSPQDLPDEILGLVNNFILHKIGDGNVIGRLKRSIGSIDDSLWNRLSELAPGQAIVTSGTMNRPLLVAMGPTPCQLLLVD